MDSVFDDRELAIFEAKRIEEGTRYAGVKVIQEFYNEKTGKTVSRTLFRGGVAKARKKRETPEPAKAKGPVARTGTGKEPVRRGRARASEKKTNMLVPILVILLLLFGGLTVFLGIQHISSLK